MDTLSCHRKYINNGDKNAIFAKANVMNISAKFQLYGFWGITETSLYKSNPRFATNI